MLQQFVIPGISFALSATTVPGPLTAYIVNTTLTQGWRKALLVVFSPLITDAPIIILMTFILGQLPDDILKLIQIGGGVLLLVIARGAWAQYQAGTTFDTAKAQPAEPVSMSWRRILATGVMMNYLSPGPYLFWATVNGPILVSALEISPLHALVFLVSFYGVFMLGLSGWVFLFNRLRRVNEKYLGYIILLTIILLVWYGTALMASSLGLSDFHAPVMLFALGVFGGYKWWVRGEV